MQNIRRCEVYSNKLSYSTIIWICSQVGFSSIQTNSLGLNFSKLSKIFRAAYTASSVQVTAAEEQTGFIWYTGIVNSPHPPLPPGRPSSGFVDSSLSTEGSEKSGEGEWRRAAGPDGVLSRFVWDDKANENEQWNPCEVRMSHVIIILCLGSSIPVINNTFCP